MLVNCTTREYSSAGSEHLPYKQRVRGSNPCAPTNKKPLIRAAFCFAVLNTPYQTRRRNGQKHMARPVDRHDRPLIAVSTIPRQKRPKHTIRNTVYTDNNTENIRASLKIQIQADTIRNYRNRLSPTRSTDIKWLRTSAISNKNSRWNVIYQ